MSYNDGDVVLSNSKAQARAWCDVTCEHRGVGYGWPGRDNSDLERHNSLHSIAPANSCSGTSCACYRRTTRVAFPRDNSLSHRGRVDSTG